MSEPRKFADLITHECPMMGICLVVVTESQYDMYCREITEDGGKTPNYAALIDAPIPGCNEFRRLQNIPRMWKSRGYSADIDRGSRQARDRA